MTESDLSAEMHKMNVSLTRVEANVNNLLERIMPAVEKQAQSMIALNDVTIRQEERLRTVEERVRENRADFDQKTLALRQDFDIKLLALERKAGEDKAEALKRENESEDRLKKRGDDNARLITMICGGIGTAVVIGTFLINNWHR